MNVTFVVMLIINQQKKMVKCLYCHFECCRLCCEKYILDQTELKCMNCGKEWTRNFLRKNFTNKFIDGEYKKHCQDILFQNEVALLPATQILAERKQKKEELYFEIRQLERKGCNLRKEFEKTKMIKNCTVNY